MLAAGRGLVLSVYGLAVSIVLFVLAVVSIAFVLLGIGVFTTPVVLQAVRRHANQRRFWAADWSGVRISAPYRPFPPDLRGGVTGQVERTTLLLKDPATWRDLQWLLVDMTVGPVVAMLAAALLIYPVEGSSWRRGCGTCSGTTPTGTGSCPWTARGRPWPRWRWGS
ncbi:hypothetical protein Smic_19620 [Streptomyces microflavus]|uniref:Putative sensor domain-containing protein n=1 Tax=Streptomyces microflavus TaxID=1919 RepID=A0A7J0CLP3_STRMI|nr:hypothetical protein Smic_19620 [Streptomyces microflavus]